MNEEKVEEIWNRIERGLNGVEYTPKKR